MINIQVNGNQIQAKEGETILSALKRAGIKVPTLCHYEGLPPTGACRMCVVEIEGFRTLVPSCSQPVAEGMKIQTHSQRAIQSRKMIVELLLANHPDDCLYCARNGNCELQNLSEELGVRQRRYAGGKKNIYHVDLSSPSIVRDPAKCILCGKCVRVCEEVQGVSSIDFVGRGSKTHVGTAFNKGLNVSSCINCGQCIMVCPTGALTEQTHIKQVKEALEDKSKVVVIQHAPSISVSLAEEFGVKPGVDVNATMVTALRMLGFKYVFDTSFTADLTIMEEASELVHRIKNGGALPMMTSCSPGWIKYVEEFYPDFIPHLSTCKSPQAMLGALIKSYWAEKMNIDPKNIFSVTVMPCTAKKFEAGRPELSQNDLPDIDAVLTTRELAQFIKMHGLDLGSLEPDSADNPFGTRSTAGKLFGASGGVMEAAIRTAHNLITGEDMKEIKLKDLRGFKGIKEATVKIGELEVNVAVVSGLGNARKVVEDIRAGRKNYHFVEVMTCPGGCIAGGGQPLNSDPEAIKARMKVLYDMDRDEHLRQSHDNPAIKKLYEEYLGEPLGHRSHELLHTSYGKRDVLI